MKKVTLILALMISIAMIFTIISCDDDDSTGPTITPDAKATIQGALNLDFEGFSSTFSQEQINYDITSKYICTMDKNGNTYKLMFEYNDYFEEQTYDLVTGSVKASFTINNTTVYDQIVDGELNVETKEDSNFDANFGFIATSKTTSDTIYVTGGEINHDMD